MVLQIFLLAWVYEFHRVSIYKMQKDIHGEDSRVYRKALAVEGIEKDRRYQNILEEKAMAKSKLKPRFIPDRSNVLVTDDHNAYNRVLYGTKARHEVVPAGQHAAGKYNLAKVNGLHSGMDSYLDRYKGRAFSIKYLDLNLMLFWWLQKYKDYPVEEKVQALYNIMNDEIPDIDTRERVNQVTMAELQSREISLDTKGKFPTRL